MKKRFSESQILKVLQAVESGRKISEVCREHGISEPTYYNWKKRYGGMDAAELQKLKKLEEENRNLKRLLADSLLDNDALKALVEKYCNAR